MNNMSTNSQLTAQKTPQITEAIKSLENAVTEAEATTQALRERLLSVTRSEPIEAPQFSGAAGVPLAIEIQGLTHRLLANSAVNQQILRTLEV